MSDARMVSPLLRDVRLQRTYAHEAGRWALLGSDVPERMTMPPHRWLPNRYRISYRWPIQKSLVQKQAGRNHLFQQHQAR